MLKKLQVNDSNYAWREHWSKSLRETGRVENINGTKIWKVNRHNFTNIPDDLKELYEKRIQIKGLNSFKISEDKAAIVYRKLNIGQVVTIENIRKIAKLPNNKEGNMKAKKIIDKLVNENNLKSVSMGKWETVDPIDQRKKMYNI